MPIRVSAVRAKSQATRVKVNKQKLQRNLSTIQDRARAEQEAVASAAREATSLLSGPKQNVTKKDFAKLISTHYSIRPNQASNVIARMETEGRITVDDDSGMIMLQGTAQRPKVENGTS